MQRQKPKRRIRMPELRSRYGLYKHASFKERGNTDLHELAQHSQSPRELKYYLDHRSEDVVVRMAKTTNNAGELPLDVVLQRSVATESEQKRRRLMADMLFPPTMKNQLKPLQKLLTESEVLKRYRHDANQRLKRNLLLAQAAVNAVRSLNIKSATHPDVDKLSQTEKERLRADIREARERIKNELKRWPKTSKLSSEDRKKYLNDKAAKIKKYKLGNCGEYGDLLADEILHHHTDMRVDIFRILNGDHVFVVIDRDPQSDKHDYQTWGEHAVVCDAWAGLVYAARDLPKYLSAYHEWYVEATDETVQVISGFNPQYHQLKVKLSVAPQPAAAPTLHNSF